MKSSDLTITTLTVTPFQQHCRVLFQGDQALIVDPGGEVERIIDLVSGHTVQGILLTHSHIDHVGGVARLMEEFAAPLVGHPADQELRQRVEEQALYFGLDPKDYRVCPEPTQLVQGGERLKFLDREFEVRFTPGHAPGHVVYFLPYQNSSSAGGIVFNGRRIEQPVLFAGDTLFAGAIGRTDFPGCSQEVLLASIKREILTLPDQTLVLPGHGPETTVARERVGNEYLSPLLV